jgi:toxin ParE1/3/4
VHSYKLTNKAVEDLDAIWEYTFETWSEQQADRYYHLLIATCENLAINPKLGKKYTEITEQLLGFLVGRHIIFYLANPGNKIVVVRILHAQMDLKRRIDE